MSSAARRAAILDIRTIADELVELARREDKMIKEIKELCFDVELSENQQKHPARFRARAKRLQEAANALSD